jgi:hypothetical protein
MMIYARTWQGSTITPWDVIHADVWGSGALLGLRDHPERPSFGQQELAPICFPVCMLTSDKTRLLRSKLLCKLSVFINVKLRSQNLKILPCCITHFLWFRQIQMDIKRAWLEKGTHVVKSGCKRYEHSVILRSYTNRKAISVESQTTGWLWIMNSGARGWGRYG